MQKILILLFVIYIVENVQKRKLQLQSKKSGWLFKFCTFIINELKYEIWISGHNDIYPIFLNYLCSFVHGQSITFNSLICWISVRDGDVVVLLSEDLEPSSKSDTGRYWLIGGRRWDSGRSSFSSSILGIRLRVIALSVEICEHNSLIPFNSTTKCSNSLS